MATNFAYICNSGANTVSVCNLSTFATVATVAVGAGPRYCATRPDNSEVWVTNSTGNSISVINTTSLTVTATITGLNLPEQIVFNNENTTAYVLNQGAINIIPIDTTSHVLGTPITTSFHVTTYLASNPTADSIVACTQSSGGVNLAIQQIAIPSGALSPVLSLNGVNFGVCYDANGIYIFHLAGGGGTSVDIVDVATNTIDPASPLSTVPQTPVSADYTPDGTQVFVASGTEYQKISVSGLTIGPLISAGPGVGPNIFSTSITADGTAVVFVSNGAVTVQSIPANTNLATLTTGSNPIGSCVTPTKQKIPVTLTIGQLFIPRKGFGTSYQPSDLLEDWLAIERWANTGFTPAGPQLFIPRKTSTTATDELVNWLSIQNWAVSARSYVIGKLGGSVQALFIPRKTSQAAVDRTANFLAVQDWANGL